MVLCKDVPVDEFCFEADGSWIVGHAGADVVQHMIFSWWFWPDDVIHVKDIDVVSVPQICDPDELLHDDHDVTVDGWWDGEEVGSTDAGEVQHLVLDDAVQLDDCWGLMPPLGKVPEDVEDVEDDVRLDDDLLDVGS